ncbi:hypothetical protein GCM10011529_19680 [Polymorphobacter glacialis]|uniref:Uncharacterized protein n=1 Tax=Sandarakinorhabdus glacialis TaxID=1614636 RepID=A0A916ZTF3_9SPHN|nr:hypothetical protein GCM10011529_19680 [Polymorphobacter glacialis]
MAIAAMTAFAVRSASISQPMASAVRINAATWLPVIACSSPGGVVGDGGGFATLIGWGDTPTRSPKGESPPPIEGEDKGSGYAFAVDDEVAGLADAAG